MDSDYLTILDAQQREAVEYGIGISGEPGDPLLIIAGAGSGKTNTLAHRVAHLIICGADPRHILLLTFSRRAASEMNRRVERIVGQALKSNARVMLDALTWAGTFHAIGARILREFAPRIGLDPAFTIHDREDSADLMNLVRHEIGLSITEKRFPTKGTCLAIYSRAVNSQKSVQEVVHADFSWCSGWVNELQQRFGAYGGTTGTSCGFRAATRGSRGRASRPMCACPVRLCTGTPVSTSWPRDCRRRSER
jgi:DNA helicase-2/ATP-dependent DNA helicase PcrA